MGRLRAEAARSALDYVSGMDDKERRQNHVTDGWLRYVSYLAVHGRAPDIPDTTSESPQPSEQPSGIQPVTKSQDIV